MCNRPGTWAALCPSAHPSRHLHGRLPMTQPIARLVMTISPYALALHAHDGKDRAVIAPAAFFTEKAGTLE